MPTEEELREAESELVRAIAKGLFFLEGPLIPNFKWDHAQSHTRELYLAKARFVVSYLKEDYKT